MSINLRCDGVGLEELADEVAPVRPDVLVLLGADPETREYFTAEGWPGPTPDSTFHPLAADAECGRLVLSNHALADATPLGATQPVITAALPTGPLTVIPSTPPRPSTASTRGPPPMRRPRKQRWSASTNRPS